MATERIGEKEEIKAGLSAIWKHVGVFKKELTFIVFLGLVSSVANGSVPYITGRFFDALIGISQHRTDSFGQFPLWTFLLFIWVIIELVANNIDWVIDRLRRRVDTKIHLNIQTEGFIHLFRLPLSYHKNAYVSGEIQKLSTAGWRISNIVQTVINIAPQFLSILIGIALAASINITLASVLLIGVILYVMLLIKILLPAAKIDSAAHRAWNEGWNDSAEAVFQIESVKQAVAEDYESKKARSALLGKTYDLWYKLETIWSNVNFFQRTVVFATQLTIFIMSVKFVANGALTIGELVALNGYALMFFGPFVSLGHSWQTIQNGISAAAHAEEIFRQQPEKYFPESMVQLGHISGEIKFEKVSFRYGLDQPWVVRNITFDVEPGQVIALVGESGVGKSTVVSLISGYNFPTDGKILINGIDSRKIDLAELRHQIAVVPQEVALFNDTIKENIRYGSFDSTNEEVIRAAKESYIDDFINTLPDKYNTVVGERGIKLSVGQKQRVSIARAILRNPAILILDEPTSALDAKTEKIVTGALKKLMEGRTTFIIAHRLSTVRKADKIIVLEKGKIAEQGSHNELIKKKGGTYKRLYEYQIGLY